MRYVRNGIWLDSCSGVPSSILGIAREGSGTGWFSASGRGGSSWRGLKEGLKGWLEGKTGVILDLKGGFGAKTGVQKGHFRGDDTTIVSGAKGERVGF